MSEMTQVHLGHAAGAKKRTTGFSGRAVRFCTLSPDQVAHIKSECGKSITDETRTFEFDEQVAQLGVEEMIVSFTDPVTPDKLQGATWHKPKGGQLHEQKATLFTTKDIEVLKGLYLRLHHVSGKEIEDIMGGLVGVVDEAPVTGSGS